MVRQSEESSVNQENAILEVKAPRLVGSTYLQTEWDVVDS